MQGRNGEARPDLVLTGKEADSWVPTCGDATEALGRYLVDEKHELPAKDAFDTIVKSSLEIVGRCKPFTDSDGSRTGLVIGYVQSGKTMSMTTVASIARDSGCRLVILLAGVTEILLKQSARTRLRPYLLNKPNPRSAWILIDTVDSVILDRAQLQQSVDQWRRADVPESRKRPLFITVMKNHRHLRSLVAFLQSSDMRGVPALILDDEADQAGLDNNAARRAAGKVDEASTTHRCIVDLRNALPNHTYLQYTATAQAPLLISLENTLSPDFASVLEPGKDYTGGKSFFMEQDGLVFPLPQDVAGEKEEGPPEPLMKAMREFYVGVAIGLLRNDKGPRSMLVHPSQRMNDHDTFLSHVRKAKKQWERDLREDDSRVDVLEEFRSAYDDLAKTAQDLPSWQEVAEELRFAINDIQVWKVNSEDGAEVDWDRSFGHILVGGDKLNRGYTVEGLTVTYMPRSPGAWNADTIQQRARFFGYKAKYLGLCRIYLHPAALQAYRDYVHHEEDIREQLKHHQGRPLREWQRAFLLDQRMKPTRPSVIGDPVDRVELTSWFQTRCPHNATAAQLERNRAVTDRLYELCRNAGWSKADLGAHSMAELPLREVYESFVIDYKCFETDMPGWVGVTMWLARLLKRDPEARCVVYAMSGAGITRRRGENSERTQIAQLFEGRRAKGGNDKYPGDTAFRDPTAVTIQVHRLDVTKPGADSKDKPLASDVRAIALHLPDSAQHHDFLVQVTGSR